MRITFLCPHLRIAGGVRAILTYADRLAGRGHAVTLVLPAPSRVRAWWRQATNPGPLWMPGLRAEIRWVARWAPTALPHGDVLVATAWQSAPVAAAAPARCGRRFYLVQHYESLYHGDPRAADLTYRLPLRKVVISTWLQDVLRETFGEEAEVLVTPVDPTLFHPVPAAADRAEGRVLMLHHDYPWKGVSDGLAAFAHARQEVPGLRLVGFGVRPPHAGEPYDEFHADPPQEKLAALYSSCAMYLCPSWDEGLGMPAMEAMACGAALVTYDNGGSRDYAHDGVTALVARRRDVSDLGEKLARVARDTALQKQLAVSGQAFVRDSFDWDRAVERLETILGGD